MSAVDNKTIMETLLALEPWSIEDVYTHPEDFLGHTRVGLSNCEGLGLVEFEIDASSKWYRLTEAGRSVIEKYRAGIPVDAIFRGLAISKQKEEAA